MCKKTGLVRLSAILILVAAALPVLSELSPAREIEAQEYAVEVDPVQLTVSETGDTGIFTMRLTSEPAANVTVGLSTSNNECSVSTELVILTSGNWSGGVQVTVSAVDDDVDDGTQTCTVVTGTSTSTDTNYNGIDPADVAVSVRDDGDTAGIVVDPTALTISEPDGSDSFTISLNSEPTAGVYIPLTRSDSTECSISRSYAWLTAGNWSTGVEVTVTAVDDQVDDDTQICLVQTGAATSDDDLYDGMDAEDVTVSVQDDDGAGILVSPLRLELAEPDGSASFAIQLGSQPTAPVAIGLSTSNNQCTLSAAQVTLYSWNWSTGVAVTVRAVNDAVADGTQTCMVRTAPAISSDTVYNNVDAADVTVSVADDDTAGILISAMSLTVSEPDGSANFAIRLTSQPTATVTVDLTISNNECTASPDPVILTSSNWSGGVQVTVRAVDDRVVDGTQTSQIQIGTTSADPNYDAQNPGVVTVTVLDRDITLIYLPAVVRNWPPIPGAPVLNPVDNADGDGAYTIRWSSVPNADLYILEQATSAAFSDAVEIYRGAATSHAVAGRGAARYFYRVRARNTWGDSGWSNVEQVDVLWEAEPNDDALTQANGPIVSGLTYYGTFPNAADLKDYFTFDLPASHTVELWLTNIASGQNYDLVLRNAALGSEGYSAELGNSSEHILTAALPAGRYYVQVYHAGGPGSSQPYHLRVVYQ